MSLVCAVDNCDRAVVARGYCNTCYNRLRKRGEIEVTKRRHFDERYVVDEYGCWIWTGAKNEKGYGLYRGQSAHRYSYVAAFGAIPERFVVDHFFCDNPSCVNPHHL